MQAHGNTNLDAVSSIKYVTSTLDFWGPPRSPLALSPLVDLWYTLWYRITLALREDPYHAPFQRPGQTEDASPSKELRQGADHSQLYTTKPGAAHQRRKWTRSPPKSPGDLTVY
jgi:hypothetical protein